MSFTAETGGNEGPQHFLYFFPLPHVHASLRPTLGFFIEQPKKVETQQKTRAMRGRSF
jgi:hypothetical protein